MDQPPADAEAWSDEQWIEWLQATETDAEPDERAFAPQLSSPAGVVLGAAMLGLQRAMFGEVRKPEIVIEVAAREPDDDDIKVDLDPDDPSASTVVVPARVAKHL